MKKTIVVFMLFLLVSGIYIQKSEATSFSFAGGASIIDGNADGFSEQIILDTQTIFNADPNPFDNIVFNNVEISDLTLAGTWSTLGSFTSFDFNPTSYLSGFKVQDWLATDLLVADLVALKLTTNVGEGSINSELVVNLFNVNVTAAGMALGSDILNEFDAQGSLGGILTLTLQFNGDLAKAIELGQTVITSDSGTASPATAPVPEPATLIIMGFGIVALTGIKRLFG